STRALARMPWGPMNESIEALPECAPATTLMPSMKAPALELDRRASTKGDEGSSARTSRSRLCSSRIISALADCAPATSAVAAQRRESRFTRHPLPGLHPAPTQVSPAPGAVTCEHTTRRPGRTCDSCKDSTSGGIDRIEVAIGPTLRESGVKGQSSGV